jgi:hypothetical protein
MCSLYLSHREHGLSLTQDARASSELCALVCVCVCVCLCVCMCVCVCVCERERERERVNRYRQIQSAGKSGVCVRDRECVSE